MLKLCCEKFINISFLSFFIHGFFKRILHLHLFFFIYIAKCGSGKATKSRKVGGEKGKKQEKRMV